MLIQVRDVTFGFGGPVVLAGADLSIERGERVALVGRNGAGKTTLMRLVLGELAPQSGTVTRAEGARVATLPQRVPADLTGTVFHAVALGLADWGEKLARYDELTHRLAEREDATALAELDRLQRAIERDGGFAREADIDRAISQVGLDRDAEVDAMSVGMKRRVLLARALVGDPDLLVLDEPTNHLDIDAIEWLEDFLLRRKGSLLLVTHDRALLRRIGTRFVVVDRSRVKSYSCDYDTYLKRREADLEAEEMQEAELDRKLEKEEAWAKTGIKARRTRSQARLRALEELRVERRDRARRVGRAQTVVTEAQRSGDLVAELVGVTFAYDPGKPLIRGLDTEVMRGDKIGVMGNNGTGKTTLLRLILGELTPDRGSIRHGVKLEIAYFDQLQTELDAEKTVRENLSEGDFVRVGSRRRHVMGYLQDFLFSRDQAHATVKHLSGGERNRLLLARLFTRPSNVLVLDEPTNDLDAETIELLENLLVEYQGTVLFVSHDREFLNHVATHTLVLEGDGTVGEYAGGFDDWLLQRSAPTPVTKPASVKAKPKARSGDAAPKPARLTYKEQLEARSLPDRIEALESEQAQIHGQMSDPTFYQGDPATIGRVTERLKQLETELEGAYARWEDLETRAGTS